MTGKAMVSWRGLGTAALALVRAEGGDARLGVERDLELLEEIAAEQAVHAFLLDVVRDHHELADLRPADRDRVQLSPPDGRGSRGAAHLSCRACRQRRAG